jgi:hypothetical protein
MMGREARCVVRLGDAESEGKALLETDEILFRGDFRLVIPFGQITSLQASDEALVVAYPAGEAQFLLGAAEAGKWRERILNPPSLLDKLGVKPAHRIATRGLTDAEFIQQLHERAGGVIQDQPAHEADFLFFQAEGPEALEELPALIPQIRRDGGIWIISPKGRKEFTENHVRAASRAAGLVDVKVCRFSDTHTAHKFVIPKEQR